jgi:hypothetical protein
MAARGAVWAASFETAGKSRPPQDEGVSAQNHCAKVLVQGGRRSDQRCLNSLHCSNAAGHNTVDWEERAPGQARTRRCGSALHAFSDLGITGMNAEHRSEATDVEDFTRLLIDAAYGLSFSLPIDHGRMTASVTKPERTSLRVN